MNYKRLFRDLIAHTPIFIHRFLTKKKIEGMLSFMMSYEDVIKCDQDLEYKLKMLEIYKKKEKKWNRWLERKINAMIVSSPKFVGLSQDEIETLRTQMEYAFFAYGFYPDEFVFFDLGWSNSELNRFRSFVSETERWTFRFAANDFSQSLFSDKADVYKRFSRFYKRDALVIDSDSDYRLYCDFISRHLPFVYKKVSSSRGGGVQLIDKVSDKAALFKKIRKEGKALLEERIIQLPVTAVFNESSVNTIRISTYNTRNGIKTVHGFFRSGRSGSFLDNAAIGGIFSVLDIEKGQLCTDGYDEYGGVYDVHPDSKVRFKGYSFPDWQEAVDICKSIAVEVPEAKYLSFDLAYTNKGWVLVEINPSGQFLHQTGQSEGFREGLRSLIDEMDLLIPYHLRDYHN